MPAEAESERRAVLAAYRVSRETAAALDRYVEALRRWSAVKNLVGPGTLGSLWTRHIADSLQLLPLAPAGVRHWLDLGSGAGLPGLIVAIAGPPDTIVDLVESNGRKCAFLRHAVAATGAPARVHQDRIETVLPRMRGVDVVTARALAPLAQLVTWTTPLLMTGTIGLFPKGRGLDRELTDSALSSRFAVDLIPSRTDPHARIVRIQLADAAKGAAGP